MIEELLRLLSCDEMDAEELAAAVEFVRNAPDDPELAWTGGPKQATTFAIYDALSEFVADSDKIDELHEQLEGMFEPPFPPFPHDDPSIQQSSFAYFRWLDDVLSKWAVAKGGYALVGIDPGFDDHLRVVVVYRKDTRRILELADALSVGLGLEDGSQAA